MRGLGLLDPRRELLRALFGRADAEHRLADLVFKRDAVVDVFRVVFGECIDQRLRFHPGHEVISAVVDDLGCRVQEAAVIFLEEIEYLRV